MQASAALSAWHANKVQGWPIPSSSVYHTHTHAGRVPCMCCVNMYAGGGLLQSIISTSVSPLG